MCIRDSVPPADPNVFYDSLNDTFGGRGLLFRRGLAASPYAQSITPWARSVLASRGDPLAAMYALAGDDAWDFRSWWGGREGNPFDRNNFDFMNRLRGIQSGGFLPGQNENWNTWANRRGGAPNPFQSLLDDETLGRTLINEMAGRRINPALRRGYLGSIGSSIDAWQDTNPERSVFGEFARRGFNW